MCKKYCDICEELCAQTLWIKYETYTTDGQLLVSTKKSQKIYQYIIHLKFDIDIYIQPNFLKLSHFEASSKRVKTKLMQKKSILLNVIICFLCWHFLLNFLLWSSRKDVQQLIYKSQDSYTNTSLCACK